MSGAKLALSVAAGIVMGGVCLCGVGGWLVTDHRPVRKVEPLPHKGTPAYAQLQERLISEVEISQRRKGVSVIDAWVSETKPAIVQLPGEPFLVYGALNGDSIRPVVLDAGPYVKRVTMIDKDNLFEGFPGDGWNGQLVVQLRGAQSAHLAFFVDTRER